MASAYDSDYKILEIDLAALAGKDRQEIYASGIPVAAVTIVELPLGAVGLVKVHFGEQGDGIKLRQEALTIARSPARNTGLYLTVAAAVAGTLTLLVGLDVSVNN